MARSSKRASFQRLLIAGLLLLLPPLVALACWRSGDADVFGLYSWRLFALLCGYAIAYAGACWFVFHPAADSRKSKLLMFIGAVRQHNRLRWLAALSPLILFGLACGVIYVVGVVPSPLVIGCLVNLALLVAWAEILLALAGQPDKQRRQLSLKITAAAIATLLTIVGIEVIAAVLGLNAFATWDINPRGLDAPFKTADFDTRVITNRQGLREPNDVAVEHPGKTRILIVGDSMTFGWGVDYEQAYPQVVEQLLKEKYDRREIEVINLGRPGAGPHEYLKYLRRYGRTLNPDIVVVGFLVGNDAPINSPAKLSSQADVDADYDRYLKEAKLSLADQWLARSFLIRLSYSLLNRPPSAGSGEGEPGPIFREPNPLDSVAIARTIRESVNPSGAQQRYDRLKDDGWIRKGLSWEVNPWLMHAIIRNPTGAADSLAIRDETYEAMQWEWKLVAQLLDEIRRTAQEELEAPLVVLSIPNAHLVSQRWVNFLEQRGCAVTPQMTTESVVNGWMRDWCAANNVPNVDPLTAFRERDRRSDDLYLRTDDHMTPAGYALLAEALAKELDQQLSARASQE